MVQIDKMMLVDAYIPINGLGIKENSEELVFVTLITK
jgi:ribosomal protein S12